MQFRDLKKQYEVLKPKMDAAIAEVLEASNYISGRQVSELEQELSDVIIEQQRQRVAAVEQWASQAVSLASGVNDLMNALGDAEVQKAEKSNDDQKKSLEKRLKAGMISQKEYDKQVASLDADLDAKKKKIALEQARREKALSIFQIGLNTAMAIMKIWAEVPKADFGAMTLVLTGIAASMGALQLATALAAPLPTARKGGRILGATHEQGGVLVNAEDEERIISAAPAKAFPELLNLISYIGKHGAAIPETGFAVRAATAGHGASPATMAAPAPDYEQLARSIGDCVGERMAGELRGLKVYLSVRGDSQAEADSALEALSAAFSSDVWAAAALPEADKALPAASVALPAALSALSDASAAFPAEASALLAASAADILAEDAELAALEADCAAASADSFAPST